MTSNQEDIIMEDITATATQDTLHRTPSPVPTEQEDPEPEYIFDQLATHNIKVRDFGAPLTASTDTGQQQPLPPLTPEVFDPYKGIGEFEFRLRQHPRTLPIPGRTLRRLIEIGWLDEHEVVERCSEDDLKGLHEFDERNRLRMISATAAAGETTPGTVSAIERLGYRPDGSYPYITLRYTRLPTPEERDALADSVRLLSSTVDRIVRMALAMERERERDRIEAEEAAEEMKKKREEEEREAKKREEDERRRINRKMEEERRGEAARSLGAWLAKRMDIAGGKGAGEGPLPTSRKRSPHEAWDDEEGGYDEEDSEAKRLRLARSRSETWYQQAAASAPPQQQPYHPQHTRALSQPHLQPPEKQYPAPLSAYDPQLYPDAASVIESQSQSQQSQGRKTPHRREDTPPVEGDGEEGEEDTRPNALKRPPKGLKRGLTRGRTLVQIC